MSKKTPETPLERYERLSRSLKHEKRVFEQAKRNLEKTEKEMSVLLKKLWFCPKCNIPHQIPNKKHIKEQIETRYCAEDNVDYFYKCKYVLCEDCGNYVLIDTEFMGEDDD